MAKGLLRNAFALKIYEILYICLIGILRRE